MVNHENNGSTKSLNSNSCNCLVQKKVNTLRVITYRHLTWFVKANFKNCIKYFKMFASN